MSYLLLAILLVVIKLDSRLLKKWNQVLFNEVFGLSLTTFGMILLVFTMVMFLPGDRMDGIILGFVGVILPFYLFRRDKYLHKFNASDEPVDHQAVITSDAYAVVLYWFFGTGIISFILDSASGFLFQDHSELWGVLRETFLSSAWMIFLIYQASIKFSENGFFQNLGFVKPRGGLGRIIILATGLAVFFAYVSVSFILSRHAQPITPLTKLINSNNSAEAILFFLLLAIIFAPLAEEMIFRGYFFHVLEQTKGRIVAIIIIALTFAGLHVGQYWGDWVAISMITILGFALTLLRSWTKTTIASTIMHYVYNAAVTIIPISTLIFSNPAYMKYSTMYQQLNTQQKETLLEESIKNQPQFADPYNDLAWLYASEGHFLDRALDLVNQALLISPDVPEYLDTKAEVLYKLHRYDEALDISQQLLKKDIDQDLKTLQQQRIDSIKKDLSINNK